MIALAAAFTILVLIPAEAGCRTIPAEFMCRRSWLKPGRIAMDARLIYAVYNPEIFNRKYRTVCYFVQLCSRRHSGRLGIPELRLSVLLNHTIPQIGPRAQIFMHCIKISAFRPSADVLSRLHILTQKDPIEGSLRNIKISTTPYDAVHPKRCRAAWPMYNRDQPVKMVHTELKCSDYLRLRKRKKPPLRGLYQF